MPLFAVHYTYTTETVPGRDEHRPTHRAWLADRLAEGTLLTSGPYPDGSGALLVFRADDEAALRKLLAEDPFAGQHLITDVKVNEWLPIFGAMSDA
ncbi:YciI family protein [Nocardia cyriacigeorgica]|uniref:YciI family protein n=1 Tax=Nocardia cyriacigeorgica TaxID=135487 RepID=UPI00245419B1|nr:YciI family protein [Nocardia cyriacigeorgica]